MTLRSGVGMDFLVDGVTDFFKGRNTARAASGLTDKLSDAIGEKATREVQKPRISIVIKY